MSLRVAAICALLLLGCEDRAPTCRQTLAELGISVFRDSTVHGERLQPGTKADCEDREVRRIARVLSRSLSTVPVHERRHLRVHMNVDVTNGPRVRDVEAHVCGDLLVNRVPEDETIWLHEYFHTLAGHPKGTNVLVTRSLRALEEGAADYFAATFSQNPRVGGSDGREVRDVSDPKRAGERLWFLFARNEADLHTLGLSFARELWAEHGGSPDLALALVTCLRRGAGAEPFSDLNELAKFCPAHARTTISNAVHRWMLRGASQPENQPVLEET